MPVTWSHVCHVIIRWSLATALTPLAAEMGLPALLAARALMGIGEGVAMPAMNNLLSRWEECYSAYRASISPTAL